jgi:hypothetical protein
LDLRHDALAFRRQLAHDRALAAEKVDASDDGMTLFELAAPPGSVFTRVLKRRLGLTHDSCGRKPAASAAARDMNACVQRAQS